MNNVSYQSFVASILKKDEDIYNSLQPGDCSLMHVAFGVAGESGELVDAVKKYVFYRKPIDLKNVKEELGDLEFYLQAVRDHFGFTREEILRGNVDKLSTRYSTGYSDKAAQDRADKK